MTLREKVSSFKKSLRFKVSLRAYLTLPEKVSLCIFNAFPND